MSPLHSAIAAGHEKMAVKILDGGGDPALESLSVRAPKLAKANGKQEKPVQGE